MGKHAILSASASKQWINCTPSIRLGEKYADKTSSYAQEGTDAHELCEFRLKELLSLPTTNPIENLSFYNEEMEDCANGYASYILEELQLAKQNCTDPLILIEQRLDFSNWVQDGFGTGDCVIVADGTISIIDYKHGLGIEVSADRNTQMMCYGLGALALFDGIYDIDTIKMTVYQPRKSNISTFEMSKAELYQWADEVLKPSAILAFNGEGEFNCGDWCVFCKAKNECRKRAEHNLQLAQLEFKLPPLLEDSEIEEILSRLDDLISWGNDIKEYALKRALGGKKWTGYKLVEGRSTRKYTSEDMVADIVETAGYDPYDKKVLRVTAMTKLLGKQRFEQLLGELIHKPKGKPTLVLNTDKRKELNNITDAKNDFEEEKGE